MTETARGGENERFLMICLILRITVNINNCLANYKIFRDFLGTFIRLYSRYDKLVTVCTRVHVSDKAEIFHSSSSWVEQEQ